MEKGLGRDTPYMPGEKHLRQPVNAILFMFLICKDTHFSADLNDYNTFRALSRVSGLFA